ncbi:DNA alkylation repair protein [Acetobacterium sp.]|uniref:DNA alkylation repair protein n=1 Tax=Acetobacterium sp. TaxID=1872094 RepID=UPI002F41C847
MKLTPEALNIELLSLTDEKYRKFSSALTPGTENILGVRLPVLRKLAKEIAKEDWKTYLKTAHDNSFEEIMLQGMVIGLVKIGLEERLALIKGFIPKINTWGLCDSFCTGLKFTKNHKEEVWLFLQSYLQSSETYEIRFGVVMIICYYVELDYMKPIFKAFDDIDHDDYYVKMAVAWAIASCYTKFPDITMIYLNDNTLDRFTFNKALQKITESRQVDQDQKIMIRSMKRKV